MIDKFIKQFTILYTIKSLTSIKEYSIHISMIKIIIAVSFRIKVLRVVGVPHLKPNCRDELDNDCSSLISIIRYYSKAIDL